MVVTLDRACLGAHVQETRLREPSSLYKVLGPICRPRWCDVSMELVVCVWLHVPKGRPAMEKKRGGEIQDRETTIYHGINVKQVK